MDYGLSALFSFLANETPKALLAVGIGSLCTYAAGRLKGVFSSQAKNEKEVSPVVITIQRAPKHSNQNLMVAIRTWCLLRVKTHCFHAMRLDTTTD